MSDKAEPQLLHRWVNLRSHLGLPYHSTAHTTEQVSAFADAELGAFVLHGGSAQSTGLPLTENQKLRQGQIRDAEKKRAVALRSS